MRVLGIILVSLLFRTPWKMCKLSLEKLAKIGIVKQNRFIGENCP